MSGTMSGFYSRRVALPAALACLAAALVGCESPSGPPRQAATSLELNVNRTTERHDVQLGPTGRPSALERQRLDAFVADLAGNRPDALQATISGPHTEPQLRSIAKILADDGLDPKRIAIAPAGGAPIAAAPVSIVIDRYAVVPPPCAPWQALASASADNSATRPDFGCTNQKNLGAMIADPRDLIKSASSPYADGATAASAVQRYHEDKLKPLPALQGYAVGGGLVPMGGQ